MFSYEGGVQHWVLICKNHDKDIRSKYQDLRIKVNLWSFDPLIVNNYLIIQSHNNHHSIFGRFSHWPNTTLFIQSIFFFFFLRSFIIAAFEKIFFFVFDEITCVMDQIAKTIQKVPDAPKYSGTLQTLLNIF